LKRFVLIMVFERDTVMLHAVSAVSSDHWSSHKQARKSARAQTFVAGEALQTAPWRQGNHNLSGREHAYRHLLIRSL
jgi:hypothetical protein